MCIYYIFLLSEREQNYIILNYIIYFCSQKEKKEVTFGLVIPGKSLVSETFSFSFYFLAVNLC